MRLVGVPCARKWNLERCGFAGLDVEPWSWVRGSVVGRTCVGGNVSGGRWGCGAIAWSGGGQLELCARRGVSPWRLVVSPVMAGVGV